LIVGRDTCHLDEREIIRGVVETVAENTVDGIVSPLFYGFLGGAPLAMAYRAVNTLDSMLGHRDTCYLHLGWAVARLDDLANYIPARIAGLIIIVILIILTGGLHLDGLMDTADGIFSGKSRERKLEIMKDSRVGAMGIIAFGTVLVLKIALLGEIPPGDKATWLLLMPAAGRWALVFAIYKYPYARKEGGLGSIFDNVDARKLAGASAIFVFAAIIALGVYGALLALLVYLFARIVSKTIAGVLDGLTGDAYGALCEVTETWTLFLGAVLRQ